MSALVKVVPETTLPKESVWIFGKVPEEPTEERFTEMVPELVIGLLEINNDVELKPTDETPVEFEIVKFPADVRRPLESTVKVGIWVCDPYVPGVTEVLDRIVEKITLELPSNDCEIEETSPDNVIVLEVFNLSVWDAERDPLDIPEVGR